MKFTNPNQFEQIMKAEGYKNPEDIWDLETFGYIQKSIEQLSHNIKELLNEEELSLDTKSCLEITRSFCKKLSDEFKNDFLSLLEQYRKERRQISQKIVDYLLEANFVLPSFTIARQKEAKHLLDEYGINDDINQENLLLIFQLPKPLAQFWWKGGANSWGSLSEDINDTAIEWGHFYRELMPVVWEIQGLYENEQGLNFGRINKIGEHDPQNYYYIWEISEW